MTISFKGAHFPPEVILMGIRWYVAYPLSTRHVEELMEERGVDVDHATINRWVIKYSPQLEEAFHRRKRAGSVANLAQEAMKGQLGLSVWRLSSQGVEQFGRSEPLVSLLDHQLPFLDHVHEFDPHQRALACRKRLQPHHG